jgi:hypothetical protein
MTLQGHRVIYSLDIDTCQTAFKAFDYL